MNAVVLLEPDGLVLPGDADFSTWYLTDERYTNNFGNALVTTHRRDDVQPAAGGVRAWDYTIYTRPGWPTTPTEQSEFDPLWGVVDPAAGDWFPTQALALARNASPALAH